jgi:twitching motility protein PilU
LISDLIAKGDVGGIKAIMAKSRELGMQTFDQALFDLYNKGRISYDEALKNADSVNEVRLKIKLARENSDEDLNEDLASDLSDNIIDHRSHTQENVSEQQTVSPTLSLLIDDDDEDEEDKPQF